MKTGWARALVLAVAAIAACGKGSSNGSGDGGLTGPTHLVAKWTFTGKAASGSECSAKNGVEVFITLSGTINTELHKTATIDCEKGSFDFGSPLIEELGTPFIEAALLDKDGVAIANAYADVKPELKATNVTLDFFPAMGTGGAGGMMSTSSTTTSTTTSSTTSGMGGAGGMMGTSSTTTSSSSGAGGGSSSSTSGAGGADAG